ncbi:site-2 protease family protein [Salinirubellus salinus]|uniref:Site-2 protease family protein n=1 Tax=Salinirubellus salinus TaxID=1364945 RepID=A0A9E7R6F5_9EURY|nr:site-2 protease family protein [Salinirubellus salinus]UWM56780.1 site-2 protease family protein [Salinirubellus salinus]
MLDPLLLVLVGVVLYTVGATFLKMRGRLPEYINVSGPITTLHTKRGRVLLDRLAQPKRFWRAWGNFGIGAALVVLVGSFLLVALAAVQAIQNPTPTALNEPRNVLAIPGVNQFLPLSAAFEILLGLLIGLVVHEGGHGLMCRVEDIDIESMGLALFAFIPVGAFVAPDEESRRRASRGGQTRMFAAGVMNNFAVAVVAFALLFGPVMGSIAVVSGAPVGGVLPGSPAAQNGIERGDVVTAIDGVTVEDADSLEAALAATDARTVDVTLESGETVGIERSVIVTGSASDSPLDVNSTVTAVNGTGVFTESAFREALADREVATLTTAGETETVTTPVGTLTTPIEGSAFAAAGAPAGESVVVTHIGGERTLDHAALSTVLDGFGPGDEVEVVGYVDGERETWTVTLGEQNDEAFLGVTVARGVTGMTVDDFGTDPYPAAQFLGILGGGDGGGIDSPIQRAVVTLSLPFLSATGGAGYSFAGFNGAVANFYTATGPLSVLGTGAVLLLANVLYWMAWINLIIGQFNCVPAYPLDGGHLLRTSTEAIVSRLPVPDPRSVTSAVTTTVTLVMLGGLFVVIFGPRLLT